MAGETLIAVFFIAINTSAGLWMAWGIYLGTRQTLTRHPYPERGTPAPEAC